MLSRVYRVLAYGVSGTRLSPKLAERRHIRRGLRNMTYTQCYPTCRQDVLDK